MILYYLIAGMILGIDQWTKYLTVTHISLFDVKAFIPKVMSFTYIQNTGAALSILEGKMGFFYIVTVAVVIGIVYALHTYGKNEPLFSTALAFILGGALGNLVDRVLYQYVVDMIRLEFISFPIFNVADVALTIGVGLMILYILLDEQKAKKTESN